MKSVKIYIIIQTFIDSKRGRFSKTGKNIKCLLQKFSPFTTSFSTLKDSHFANCRLDMLLIWRTRNKIKLTSRHTPTWRHKKTTLLQMGCSGYLQTLLASYSGYLQNICQCTKKVRSQMRLFLAHLSTMCSR